MIRRRYLPLTLALATLAACAVPAFAKDAPKETPEATATRVRELEKANVVLQEDLARTRLQLDITREALAKARTDLDAEVTARKILEAQTAAAQQQTARDVAGNDDATKKALAELQKLIAALSARHDADLAAAKKDYDTRLAALQQSLDTETAARLALDRSPTEKMTALGKQHKKDRMWGFALSGINLGLGLAK